MARWMIQMQPVCDTCRHAFHAKGPCTGWYRGDRCRCSGIWYDETRSISGFCYTLVGTSKERETESHAACPGKDYVYPCECDCHDDSFTFEPLTPTPGPRNLEP